MGGKMDRISQLEKDIKRHKILYYQGTPEISDDKYDQLEKELKNLSPKNNTLSMVGGLPKTGVKIPHQKKMLSLDKTYEKQELEKWIAGRDVLSTFKIDGVSCSLIYKKGLLIQGKTRGDGSVGEDITAKILWIENIPKEIIKSQEENLEVRGELYCTDEDFFHLGNEMVQAKLDKPTSQRNIVAGLVSRKDHLELSRHIRFKAFDLITPNSNWNWEQEKYQTIKDYGFDTPDFTVHKSFKTILPAINDAQDFIGNGNFQIDGLVLTLNDLSLHKKLGATAHHPRYKIAFKFKGESKQTTIEEIIWAVSRNGILTPVGQVAPTELSGAVISRVSFHNYGLIKQFALKKDDLIEIIRSGEVIPKFLSVVKSSDEPLKIPDKCPDCRQKLTIDDIRLRCVNSSCPGVIKEKILHFVQKIGIDDLNARRIDEMIKNNLIQNITDLYHLKKEDFFKLDKVKDVLATKLYSAIQRSKKVDIITFLSSLGISGSGYNKSEKIIEAGFDTIEKLKSMTVEQLNKVNSFAEKSANLFVNSLQKKVPLIDSLLAAGFKFDTKNKKQSSLSGKSVCITGSLSEKRSVVEGRIKQAGGKVTSSIGKNTNYLLTNEVDSNSSKFKKAQELNITVINEEELKKLLI